MKSLFGIFSTENAKHVEPTERVVKQVDVFILGNKTLETNTGKFTHEMSLSRAKSKLQSLKRGRTLEQAQLLFVNKFCTMVFGTWTVEADENSIEELQKNAEKSIPRGVDYNSLSPELKEIYKKDFVDTSTKASNLKLVKEDAKRHRKKYKW